MAASTKKSKFTSLRERLSKKGWREKLWNKVHKKSFFGNFIGSLLLYKKYIRISRELNIKYINQQEQDPDKHADNLRYLEQVELVINNNLGYLFSRFTICLAFIILAITVFLFWEVPSTNISLDVRVSSLNFIIKNSWDPGTNLPIEANDSITYIQDPAILGEHAKNIYFSDHEQLILDTIAPFNSIQLYDIHPPSNSLVIIDQEVTDQLKVTFSGSHPKDSTNLDWKIAFKDRVHINADNSADTIRERSSYQLNWGQFTRKLTASDPFTLTLNKPHPWKWPSRICVNNLSFVTISPNASRVSSSVINGELRLLETSDDIHKIYAKDTLDIQFKDPVELFVSGDKNGLMVHVEGKATSIIAGPTIMGKEENNRMPRFIKIYMDSAPYIGAFLACILPIIIGLFFRQRKSV